MRSKRTQAVGTLRRVRVLIGGAAAPESMFRRFDKFGIQAIQAWGIDRTSPVATVCALKPGMEARPKEELYRLRARQGLPRHSSKCVPSATRVRSRGMEKLR